MFELVLFTLRVNVMVISIVLKRVVSGKYLVKKRLIQSLSPCLASAVNGYLLVFICIKSICLPGSV